jgi:hypothetical protein
MTIHRILTITLRMLDEDTPSPSRPDPPPPLSVTTPAVTQMPTADRPLVIEHPRTDSEPLGSFSWRLGRNELHINNEHIGTTPFASLFSNVVDTFAQVGGGMHPIKSNFLECMFFPHRNNWLSNLAAPEHSDLFRFLFSSVDSRRDGSVSHGRVDIIHSDDAAFADFKRVWPEADGNANLGLLLEYAWNEKVIVIEQSPPVLTTLKDLLLTSNGVAIGGFIGEVAGIEQPHFLLATVPLGILVVGASVGVAQALQQGLRARILLLIEGKTEVPVDRPERVGIGDEVGDVAKPSSRSKSNPSARKPRRG